jgi:hypothetical protein
VVGAKQSAEGPLTAKNKDFVVQAREGYYLEK